VNVDQFFARIYSFVFFQPQEFDKEILNERQAFSDKINKIKADYVKLSTKELLELRLLIEEVNMGVRNNDFPGIAIPLIFGTITFIITPTIAYIISVPSVAISVVTKAADYPQPTYSDYLNSNKILEKLFKTLLHDTSHFLTVIVALITFALALVAITAYVLSRRKINKLRLFNRRLEVINMILAERIERGHSFSINCNDRNRTIRG